MRCLGLWMAAALCGAAFGAESISLESDSCRLQLNATSGEVESLVDKATGVALVAPGKGSLVWYELQLVDSATRLSHRQADAVRVRRDGAALLIEAEHRQPVELHVTCRLRAEPASPYVLGHIAIRSAKPQVFSAVRFPVVTVDASPGDGNESHSLLLPYCDGYVVTDLLQGSTNQQLRYPGSASMQLLAAYGKKAGLYLASQDSAAHVKTLETFRRGKSLELAIGHLAEQSPATEWSLKYDVALATLHAAEGSDLTWEAAAELYRDWAHKQPWCQTTLVQRVASGDVPKWLAEPSLFYAYSLRGLQPDGKTWAIRLPEVADQAQRWRSVLDGPVTFMLMSWEKRDSWFTPDYFPPVGGNEAFLQATRTLHEQGHRALVFLSGLKWTLHKERSAMGRPPEVFDDEAEFNRRGRQHAISDAKGEATIAGQPDKDVGRYAQICPTTPMAGEILLGSSQKCQQLGIDCVQADQIVGGGLPACFHPEHSHPPGGGNWSPRALYDLFAAIRKEGKGRDKDFAFAIEEPGEFFIPVLDTYHARDYQQGRWPRSGKGIQGVPLFTYVYHDFLHGYGGDSCYVSDKPSDLALYQQGMNLVCGKAPAVAVWTRAFDPLTTEPTQRRLLRAHFDLWRGAAHDFLVFGRKLPSLGLDVPNRELTVTEKDGKTRRTIVLPCVLDGGWRLPDGRSGWVFACVGREPVRFTALGKSFSLEPGETAFQELR